MNYGMYGQGEPDEPHYVYIGDGGVCLELGCYRMSKKGIRMPLIDTYDCVKTDYDLEHEEYRMEMEEYLKHPGISPEFIPMSIKPPKPKRKGSKAKYQQRLTEWYRRRLEHGHLFVSERLARKVGQPFPNTMVEKKTEESKKKEPRPGKVVVGNYIKRVESAVDQILKGVPDGS